MSRKKIDETKRLTELISIRITNKHYRKIMGIAKRCDVKKSDLIRYIISSFIEKQEVNNDKRTV